MSAILDRYEQSRKRLLQTLAVVDTSIEVGRETLGHQNVSEYWGTSSNAAGIHLRLVSLYRNSQYTFLLAHLEKGNVHTTSIPEKVTVQCLAGRMRITGPHGEVFIVQQHGLAYIEADVAYTYEALEETYNIMLVRNA